MIGVTWFLLTLTGLVSPISLADRCALLETNGLLSWVEAERQMSMDGHRDQQSTYTRKGAWLPDISLSAGVTLDDGDQYRISDGSQNASFRTSSLSEGGQRTQYQVRFKWFLSTHKLSVQRLSWRRYVSQERQRSHGRLGQLIHVFGRWVKHLQQRCHDNIQAPLDPTLFNLELELNHLSHGRFYHWLKESK